MHILAQVDHDRRKALHTRLRASNTASSPALARLRDSADDDEVPLHVWALAGAGGVGSGAGPAKEGTSESKPVGETTTGEGEPRGEGDAAAGLKGLSLDQADAPSLPPLAGADDLVGGLVGHTWARWLHVTYLYVAPAERGAGVGRTLLAHAEGLARERGCVAAIVQTWDFQAPEFYTANGYTVAGKVEGYPPGITDYTLVKRFRDVGEGACRVGNRRESLGVTDV